MAGRIQNVKFIREIAEDEKLAPQAKGIVESVIETHGLNTTVTVEQVTSAMEGNITTRQPFERIFGYYAPKLEEAGFIEVERSEAAAPKSKKKDEDGDDASGEISDELDDEEADDEA